MDHPIQLITAICVGVSLAAASGFRVFVPAFVMAIAARSGAMPVDLGESWKWLASDWAVIALGIATAVEVIAFYVPWLDNALDSIASPAAVVAGVLVTAAAMSDFNPMLQWITAVVGGGGSAAVVQGGTVLMRGLSLGTTGGIGNPVISTGEAAGSTAVSVLAIFIPIIVGIAMLALIVWLIRKLFFRRPSVTPPPDPA